MNLNGSGSAVCRSDRIAHADGEFLAGPDNVRHGIMQLNGILLKQHDDRTPAVEETTLFLPASEGICAMVVADLSDQKGPHLHLHGHPEMVRSHDGVFPGILDKNGKLLSAFFSFFNENIDICFRKKVLKSLKSDSNLNAAEEIKSLKNNVRITYVENDENNNEKCANFAIGTLQNLIEKLDEENKDLFEQIVSLRNNEGDKAETLEDINALKY